MPRRTTEEQQEQATPPLPVAPEQIEHARIRIGPTRRVNRRHAAAILGRSEKTLANWKARGKGPAVIMVGGRCFYNYDECVAYR
jgi:hypothetical protein